MPDLTDLIAREAEIAMARRIAAGVYRGIHCDPDFANAVEAGEADGDEAVQSALLAIHATTEAAAKLVEARCYGTASDHFEYDAACTDIATDLYQHVHLKGQP